MNIFQMAGGIVVGAGLLLFGFFHFHQPPRTNVIESSVTDGGASASATNVTPEQSFSAVPTGSRSESSAQVNTTSVQANTTSAQTSSATTYGHVYTNAELVAMAGPVDLTQLPLGDSKYTTSGAKKGYVYVCHVASGGQGAQVNGPWIHGATWDATTKVHVQGSVPWPNASMKVSVANGTRSIASNDLPTNHNTGTFPVQTSDPASQYDRNQSSITAQNNNYSLPAYPSIASTPDCIYGEVGIMTNGVTLNDAFDALYRDAPAHEEQDSCDGHPNNEEGYHYHNLSACFTSPMVTQTIGYAFDGFPITGPEVSAGKYLTSADLDECHGLTSTIELDGKQVTTYHYVLTYDFPYSVSCYRGTSHEPKPTGGHSGQGGPGMMPPPPPRY